MILELLFIKVAFLPGEIPIMKVIVSVYWSTDVEEYHKSLLHYILSFFRSNQEAKYPLPFKNIFYYVTMQILLDKLEIQFSIGQQVLVSEVKYPTDYF